MPVALQPRGRGGVEHRLQGRVRHRLDDVGHRRPEAAQGVQHALAVLDRPRVARGERQHDRAVGALGQEGRGGDGGDEGDGAELVRHLGAIAAVEAQDVAGLVDGVEHRTAEDAPERVELVGERGDDAQAAAAPAAQPPEQVRVLGLAGGEELSLRGDHVGAEQVVAARSVLAREPADAASQGEPGDAHVRHGAARSGQLEDSGLAVEVAPEQTGLRLRGAPGRVDADALHRREIEQQPALAHGLSGDPVPAAADRDRQLAATSEADGGDDVRDPGAADHRDRAAIDPAVPDRRASS